MTEFSVEKGSYQEKPCAIFIVQGNMEESIREEIKALGYELDIDITNRYIKRIFDQATAQTLSAEMKKMDDAGKVVLK